MNLRQTSKNYFPEDAMRHGFCAIVGIPMEVGEAMDRCVRAVIPASVSYGFGSGMWLPLPSHPAVLLRPETLPHGPFCSWISQFTLLSRHAEHMEQVSQSLTFMCILCVMTHVPYLLSFSLSNTSIHC